jgi:hypothetical protein
LRHWLRRLRSLHREEERKEHSHEAFLEKSDSLWACWPAFRLVASAVDVDGILIDKACSTKALSGGQAVANGHDRDCLLQESCVGTGYGVYTADGKYLNLDAAGDTRALAAIKASKQRTTIRCESRAPPAIPSR